MTTAIIYYNKKFIILSVSLSLILWSCSLASNNSNNSQVHVIGGGSIDIDPFFYDSSDNPNSPILPWIIEITSFKILNLLGNSSKIKQFSALNKFEDRILDKHTQCSGVLLNHNTFLTARHCFYPVVPFSYFANPDEEFSNTHYIQKPNDEMVLISMPGSNDQDKYLFPKTFFTFIPNPNTDIMLVHSNKCSFYNPNLSNISPPLINDQFNDRYQDLSIIGSGGTYYYEKLQSNNLKMASDLEGIDLKHIPSLYVDATHPPAFKTNVEICSELHKKRCLVNNHWCYRVFIPLINQSQNYIKTCKRHELQVNEHLIKLNLLIHQLSGNSSEKIYQYVPGLKDTLFLYDPLIKHKSNQEKSFICFGDSGSPVLDNQNRLIGIVSNGGILSKINLPEGNTMSKLKCSSTVHAIDLSKYYHWINDQLQQISTNQNTNNSYVRCQDFLTAKKTN